MKIFHYNKEEFETILTKDLQGGIGKKERKEAERASKYRSEPGPYYDSVSFLLEPAPLDILSSIFPKDHHTWGEGQKLVEHVIDVDDIDLYSWMIVEGRADMLFINNLPWFDNDLYKKTIFKSRSLGKHLLKESGNDIKSLKKFIEKFPSGLTRQAYMEIAERDDYDDIKDQYAATVPHLMVYTKKPIEVSYVNKVRVGYRRLSKENKTLKSLEW